MKLRDTTLLLALLAASAAGEAKPVQTGQILGVALDTQTDTRLTLSLSTAVVPHVFTLPRPDRVVIDLPRIQLRSSQRLPAAAGEVLQVRAGTRSNQVLRLVLELNAPRQPRVTTERTGGIYRLQIVLSEAGAVSVNGATTGATTGTVSTATTVDTAAPGATAARATVTAESAAPPVLPAGEVRAAHAPSVTSRDIVIAVDAGHGGDDPGATGANGTHEKDVVLSIARALEARIDREPGMRAVLTRSGDYFIPLRGRMDRARAAHADMFISIHADAVRDRNVSGASVYILSERGASNEAARILADSENAADLKGGVPLTSRGELNSVLLDLSQSANIGASVEAAGSVLGALDGVGAVRKREVQQAAFVVLKSPSIPSMLVETAYISNPAEERKLRADTQQRRLAAAIFSGVEEYFRKYPPDGTQFAQRRNPDEARVNVASN